MREINMAAAALAAGVNARPNAHEAASAEGRYAVEARNSAGVLLWREEFDNLVTTQGKNALLDTFIGRGAAYANCYLGLIASAATPVSGDTYATRGFVEAGSSIITARQAPAFNPASGGSKGAPPLTFTLLSNATIYGAVLVFGPSAASAAGDTAASGAILYSAGQFGTPRALQANDTISVTYSASV